MKPAGASGWLLFEILLVLVRSQVSIDQHPHQEVIMDLTVEVVVVTASDINRR